MSKKMPLISVIIPVYNEAANIQWFYEELTSILSARSDIAYELIYVNDGSRDDTHDRLTEIASGDSNVRYLCLARNFGKEAATTAGINEAAGDALIIIDGDGQHPPAVMMKMIDRWLGGAQQVVGIRTSNKNAGVVKTAGSKLFYMIAHTLGAKNMLANATDFRLIDRELADTFKLYTERKRMTRALLDWSGFQTEYIEFDARDREYGTASYSVKALLRLAVNGYVGATLKPLYFVGSLGGVITFGTLLLLLFLAINDLLLGDALGLGVTNSGYMALFITMLVGVIMVCQGIVALYVANIHLEVQNRPLYIINKSRSKL